MHGLPALPPDFPHLPYADPAAPKGGMLTLGQLGTFDSLNPLIMKGVAAPGVRDWVYESLLGRSFDEPFTLYGLIADRVSMPDDRNSVTFHINPAARFADGRPVIPEDVAFSWKLLLEKGVPYLRTHYRSVARTELPGNGEIRFVFNGDGNREAPLLLGLMPILPSHAIDPETFERTTFEPPLASGPYRIAQVDPGRRVTYRRNPEWWGRDLPINRGRYNFDEIRYEFFRDQTTLFEAFKAGEVTFRPEDDATRWAEGYKFPAVADGRIRKLEIATALPAGMTALVFNTRRPVFADARVRQAFIALFDFEWINARLFNGVYARTQSYFERSELSSAGRSADTRETALLAPYKDRVKPEVMAGTYRLPVSDGSGHNRASLAKAFQLLKEAGYEQRGGKLVKAATGEPFAIEMMASSRTEERLFQAYAPSLEQLGIAARIRLVDSAQRWARMRNFDFDMIQWAWPASLSPGNEQVNRWSTEAASTELSLNYPGVREPGVDRMIDALLSARERPEFVSAVRALDRLLISGDYVIPLYYPRTQWIGVWSQIGRPQRDSLAGYTLDTWYAAR